MRRHSARAVPVVLALGLAACTSSSTPGVGPGHGPGPGPGRPRELTVYLCARTSPAPCSGRTSATQLSVIRRTLRTDPSVTGVHYRSEAEQYRRATRRLRGRAARLLKPGDLPASFVVRVRDAAHESAVSARLGRLAGVSAVTRCASTC